MRTSASIAAIALALLACGSAAAEEVYRCGNAYSQKPCPGGTTVQVEDTRSAAQNKASIEQTQRDAKSAEAMQKERVKEEAKPAQALLPASRASDAEFAEAGKPKKTEFGAVEPRKRKEPAPKKKSGKKADTKQKAASKPA